MTTVKARPLLVLVAAVLVIGVTARLGLWQLDRAQQKLQLQAAQLAQRALPALALDGLPATAAQALALQHRLVHLRGLWLPEHTVYLDNRQMNGRPGFYALTPLRLADGSAVLVQRGWLPRDLRDRSVTHGTPPPAGEVGVTGRIAPGASRLYEFDAVASGPIRQNLDINAYGQEIALPLRPVLVVQEEGQGAPQDGLLRQWPVPAADVHKHHGYAFQWFALSATTFALYVWFQLIRPRRHARARHAA